MGRKKITRRGVSRKKVSRRKVSRRKIDKKTIVNKRRKTTNRRYRTNNRITHKKGRKSTKRKLYKKGKSMGKSIGNLIKILKKLKKIKGLQRGGGAASLAMDTAVGVLEQLKTAIDQAAEAAAEMKKKLKLKHLTIVLMEDYIKAIQLLYVRLAEAFKVFTDVLNNEEYIPKGFLKTVTKELNTIKTSLDEYNTSITSQIADIVNISKGIPPVGSKGREGAWPKVIRNSLDTGDWILKFVLNDAIKDEILTNHKELVIGNKNWPNELYSEVPDITMYEGKDDGTKGKYTLEDESIKILPEWVWNGVMELVKKSIEISSVGTPLDSYKKVIEDFKTIVTDDDIRLQKYNAMRLFFILCHIIMDGLAELKKNIEAISTDIQRLLDISAEYGKFNEMVKNMPEYKVTALEKVIYSKQQLDASQGLITPMEEKPKEFNEFIKEIKPVVPSS